MIPYTIQEINYKGYTIEVQIDATPQNPRNWGTLGTIAANHRQYDLADDDGFEPSNTMDFLKTLARRSELDIGYVREVKDWLYTRYGGYENHEYASDIADEYFERRIQHQVDDNYLVIPVFMYEHSGVALKTGASNPFHSPWDSGQVGWIYVPLDKIEDEYGDLSEESIDTATSVLQGEIETYSAYINSDVYGYQVEDPDGHPVEMIGCWGFFDQDYVIDEAEREIDATIKKRGETEPA